MSNGANLQIPKKARATGSQDTDTAGWSEEEHNCSELLPSSPLIGLGSAECADAGSSRRQAGHALPFAAVTMLSAARPPAPARQRVRPEPPAHL